MATLGGTSIVNSSGNVTSLGTGTLNVTGSDLCIIAGGVEDASQDKTLAFEWDDGGANEALSVASTRGDGTYLNSAIAYLDDPSTANSEVTMTLTGAGGPTTCCCFMMFFTSAAAIVATDEDNNGGATSGTSSSITVPNAASGDIIVDMLSRTEQTSPTVGADQTSRGSVTEGSYLALDVSTQAGADGGVMSWTFTNTSYGYTHHGIRVPDAGAGPAGPDTPQGLHGIMHGINVQRSTRLGGEIEE